MPKNNKFRPPVLLTHFDDLALGILNQKGCFHVSKFAMWRNIIWVKNSNTGNDEIRAAIKEAKVVTDKPTLIKVSNYMILQNHVKFSIFQRVVPYLICSLAGDNNNWVWVAKQGKLVQCLMRPKNSSSCALTWIAETQHYVSRFTRRTPAIPL